jgi:hypothetical protein
VLLECHVHPLMYLIVDARDGQEPVVALTHPEAAVADTHERRPRRDPSAA